MVGSKQPAAVWLTPEEADRHCRAGASVWPFASTDKGVNPDVVICGIGAEMMFEVVAAAAALRKLAPELRVRVVNVTDLMVLGEKGSHPHALSNEDFDALFTEDKAVHFNYHGMLSHEAADIQDIAPSFKGCCSTVQILIVFRLRVIGRRVRQQHHSV